jgi:hypothetical protein
MPLHDPETELDGVDDALAEAPEIELEEALDQLHAVRCAAHAHFLRILAAYDARKCYRTDGATSSVGWVRCRVHVSLKTAREWVRVANKLTKLPAILSAYAEGRLSWDHVRALTKFATPETDAELAEEAQAWTAEMAAYMARRSRSITAEDAEAAHDRRGVSFRWDEARNMFHLRARLAIPDGEILVAALDRLADRQPRDIDGTYQPGHVRLADALVELASTKLVDAQDADRAVVVIHTDVETLAKGEGHAEFESGQMASAETVARLVCDGYTESVVEDANGTAVGIGRRSRNIPGWMVRQLRRRDQGCRFPGCGRRRLVHGHHIERWPRGPTNLDNLTLLCRWHHHLVHEGKWKVKGNPEVGLEFIRPDGRVFEPAAQPLRPEVAARIPIPTILAG